MRSLFLLACGSMACSSAPEPPPAVDPAVVRGEAGLPLLAAMTGDTPLEVERGQPSPYPGYTVEPVSFQALPGFRASAALWLPDGRGPFPGVLVVPGHFGEGKSSGEIQGAAHALAARGVAALAVDPPGVEEWSGPGRQIHFDGGAHNRALLMAAGTSALGLQLHVLERGLASFRELAPLGEVGVLGVSGGASLAAWLLLWEEGLAGGAMVSYVPLPREPDAGGCFCDLLPGRPGPDPRLLGAMARPTIWVAETPSPRPAYLPPEATWRVVEGPHGFTREQREVVLPWLDRLLGHSSADRRQARAALASPPHTPSTALQSPGEGRSIADLLLDLAPRVEWAPRPVEGVSFSSRCRGEGPPVVLAGGEEEDEAALLAAGLQVCVLSLDDRETDEPRLVASGHALVDRPAGAVRAAVEDLSAVGAYGRGAWAVSVAAAGVTAVLRDPPRSLGDVDEARDPAWVHVPGGWWGGLAELYSGALAVGDDSESLAASLGRHSSE